MSAINMDLAREAATANALLELLERVARLEVSPGLRLSELLDAHPAVRNSFRAALATAARVDVQFEPDQVVRANASIELNDAIATLARVCADNEIDRFRAPDFSDMVLFCANLTYLRGEGLAIPPTSAIAPATLPIDLDAPPWAAKSATATGKHQPEPGDAFPPMMVMEFSRLEAIVALEEQLTGLRLADRVTVGDFLARHAELTDDVVLLLSSARAMETLWADDGSVETRVELPLERLWLILARAMETVEVDLDANGRPILNDKNQP